MSEHVASAMSTDARGVCAPPPASSAQDEVARSFEYAVDEHQLGRKGRDPPPRRLRARSTTTAKPCSASSARSTLRIRPSSATTSTRAPPPLLVAFVLLEDQLTQDGLEAVIRRIQLLGGRVLAVLAGGRQ